MKKPNKKKKPTLLVPKPISFNLYSRDEKGIEKNGTKAFVDKDLKLIKTKSKMERGLFLKNVAHNATYFIKPISPKQISILKKMKLNGIKTEKVMQNLKNGTFLIKKQGYSLDSKKGQELIKKFGPMNILVNLEELIAKFHSLGISHNHLHMGNLCIDKKGNLYIIDLSLAKSFKVPAKVDIDWLAKKFFHDIKFFSSSASLLLLQSNKRSHLTPYEFTKSIQGNILNYYGKYFKLSPKEIVLLERKLNPPKKQR